MATTSKIHGGVTHGHKSHVKEAVNDVIKDGKKFAHALQEDSLNKVHEVEESIKEYSDKMLSKVQKNPLTSVLIAGGVGFLLASFLRK